MSIEFVPLNLPIPPASPASGLEELSPLRAVVFSGPLGSGKTSLINALLTRSHDTLGSFVVIENDIGNQNIDKTRLLVEPERVMALTSGCICCNDLTSLKASVTALNGLQSPHRPDTVIIETTGIADPATVKRALYDLKVPSLLIVTVDVMHFDQNTLLRRGTDGLAVADVFAFTWWDHAGGVLDLKRVVKAVRAVNSTAGELFVDLEGSFRGSNWKTLIQNNRHALPRGGESDSGSLPLIEKHHRHREVAISLMLKPGTSPHEVVNVLSEEAGDSLLRVKGHCGGHEIDCVQGTWRIRPDERQKAGAYLNVITSRPIDLSKLDRFVQPSGSESDVDLSSPHALGAAIELVSKLIKDFPATVISPSGNLTTECDSGEGWRYVSNSAFPEHLRNQFLSELASFYWKQLQALNSGRFDSHPSFPFYQKEVGANLSWVLLDCADLLDRQGIKGEIVAQRPFSLYFSGLRALTLPSQLNRLRDQDLPYLQARLTGIREERGSDAEQLIDEAFANADRLSLDSSWKKVRERLDKAL